MADTDDHAATAAAATDKKNVHTKDAKHSDRRSMAADHRSMSADRRSMSLTLRGSQEARYSIDGHLIPAVKPGQRQYQATYRLRTKTPVNTDTLYTLTKYAVESAVNANALVEYNPRRSNRFCQTLAREIQRSVASEGFDRFRIVALVQLAERTNQSAWSKMGFMWDGEHDTWTTYFYEAQNFVISATVLCVYYE